MEFSIRHFISGRIRLHLPAENKSLPKPPSFGSKRSTALSGRG
jgi:hypothetical protein